MGTHKFLKPFLDEGMARGYEVEFDGTVPLWIDSEGHTLGFRGERQALPAGAVPLYAYGGNVIGGQWFTRDDVIAYSSLAGTDIVVFERYGIL
jgi:hypothetical protein